MSRAVSVASLAPPPSAPLAPRVWWAAMFVLLWLALFVPTRPVAMNLDDSWRMALAHAWLEGWQWGRDLVFTYGPLGWLMANTDPGQGPLGWMLWSNFAFAGLTAATVLYVSRRLSPWRRGLFLAGFLIFAGPIVDSVHVWFLLLVLLEAALREGPRAPGWWLAAAVCAGFSAHIKFTHTLLAFAGIGTVVGLDLLRREWRRPLWLGGGFAVSFVAIWMACGQALAWLPAHLLRAFDVAGGYGEAMALGDDAGQVALGLAALAGVAALLLAAWRAAPEGRTLAPLALVVLATFLQWKHGFTRADGHVLFFCVHTLLLALALPPLIAPGAAVARWTVAPAVAVVLLAVVGMERILPGSGVAAVEISSRTVREGAYALSNPRLRLQWVQEQREDWRAREALPLLERFIAGGSVDVLGHSQAVALLGGYHYRPRPILQSYSAYRPRLAALNAEHFTGDRAPDFVLHRLETVDGRLTTGDDAPALREILRRYALVAEENGFFLWRHRRRAGGVPVEWPLYPIDEYTLAPGEVLELPPLAAGEALWLEADLAPNLLGRLRQLLYKTPPFEVELEPGPAAGAGPADLRPRRHRLPRGVAAHGVFVSPELETRERFLGWIEGRPGRAYARLRLSLPPGGERWYPRTVRVRLWRVPPVPEEARPSLAELFRSGAGFDTAPVQAEAGEPWVLMLFEGRPGVIAHAPSKIVLPVATEAAAVEGRFGINPEAYRAGRPTDGVEFVVVHRTGESETELLRRFLEPARFPSHRGSHAFHVDLPATALGRGEVVLRTLPGPRGDAARDWSVWQQVAFAGAPDDEARRGQHFWAARGRFLVDPLAVQAAAPPVGVTIEGQPMVQLHAPAEIVLPARPKGGAFLVGEVGFPAGAYSGEGRSDGIELVVLWQPADGGATRELLRRRLDPAHRAGDRGVVPWAVDLRPQGEGHAIVRLEPGPAGDAAFDWSCLGGVGYAAEPSPLGRAAARRGLEATEVEGRAMVLAHAPWEFGLPVPKQKFLSGYFGSAAAAWGGAPGARSDGMEFAVLWRSRTEEIVLWETWHDPANDPAHRGLRRFLVDLGPRTHGEIVLRVHPGPQDDARWDHAAWGGLRFTDDPPPEFVVGGEHLPPAPEVEPPPAPESPPDSVPADLFRGAGAFRDVPRAAVASVVPYVAHIGGTPGVLMHATSEMIFDLPADALAFAGRFGLADDSYTGGNNTDGAEFVVEWRGPGPEGGRRVLFSRHLRPREVPADRGWHAFVVTIDPQWPAGGHLVLRTLPGPEGDGSWDWTLWRGVGFAGSPPSGPPVDVPFERR
jgi:hypothetical protein